MLYDLILYGGKFQLLRKVCYVSGQQSTGELIARATV